MIKALAGKIPPLDIELQPANEGEVADIENLYFVGDQAILLPKSEPELPKILLEFRVHIGKKSGPYQYLANLLSLQPI